MMTNDAIQGTLFMAALLISFGPQNVYVLRTGVAGLGVGRVVLVCCLADIGLMGIGVLGMGAVLETVPTLLSVLRLGAIASLTCYTITTLLRFGQPLNHAGSGAYRHGTISGAALVTFLNPSVYLDTVLLVGSRAALCGPIGRWWFGIGAVAASCLWYFGLGYGGRAFSRLLNRSGAACWIDSITVIALVMSITILCGE